MPRHGNAPGAAGSAGRERERRSRPIVARGRTDGARAVSLRAAEAAVALVVDAFGADSPEVAAAGRHVATMREHAQALGDADLERFFNAEGLLTDLERKARAREAPHGGNGKAVGAVEDAGEDAVRRDVLVRVASVAAQRVEWLWMHRLPLGKLCVLDGDPGLGKSTVTLDLAARLSVGRTLPDDERPREAVGVVILSADDDTLRHDPAAA